MIEPWIVPLIGLLGLGLGSITDFQKREVPDFLNFLLITVGLTLGLISSIHSTSVYPFLSSLIGFGVGALIGVLLYYTGQWGGGDAKMLMGLGALHGIPLLSVLQGNWPFFLTIIITIFFVGSIFSLIYFFIWMAIQYKKTAQAIKRVLASKTWKQFRIVYLISILVCIGLLFYQWALGSSLFILLLMAISIPFLKEIQQTVMTKNQPLNKVVPGDWLVDDIYDEKGKLILKKRPLGVEPEDIEVLKKSSVKTILIRDGVPFIPGMLAGYITSLVLGNWVATLLNLLV